LQQLPEGSITSPAGFRAAAVAANLKYTDRLDLTLIVSDRDCSAAGVFTRNQVVAAPVLLDKAVLAANNRTIRAIVANAGNANACTGATGMANGRAMQAETAAVLNLGIEQVLQLSTGVIGMQLPMEKLKAGIQQIAPLLAPDHGIHAARAIMTTDTHPKHAAVRCSLSGGDVTIGGIAKGSGMIHPDMATMLGVLTTDAAVAPDLLQELLGTAVNASFNRISVDGDTSTNDTVLLLANGAAGVSVTTAADRQLFEAALTTLCVQLAQMIVRDGEGASKFVTIEVTGAADDEAATAVAQTIATSPLVKTAFAGSDANWGRILAAAGRAGVPLDQTTLALRVGIDQSNELQLVGNGTPTAYAETDAARIFAAPEFKLRLDLGAGSGHAVVWTTDLTHDYVSINADYRT